MAMQKMLGILTNSSLDLVSRLSAVYLPLNILAMASTAQKVQMLKQYSSMLSWCFSFWSEG